MKKHEEQPMNLHSAPSVWAMALICACCSAFAVDNDATSWVDQTPPPFGLMQDGIFLTPRIGLMTGNKTWRTSDGGRTWVEVCAQGFWNLTFADDQVGWACTGGWAGPPGLIYKTSDGGQTWHEVFRGPVGLMAVAAGDRDHIVAGSPWRSDSVWVSDDGGTTWQERQGAGADVHGLLAAGPSEFFALGLEGRLAHTTDAGITWTTLCTVPGKRCHHGSLLRLEDGTLFATFAGGLHRSEDGGHTFAPVAGAPAGCDRLDHGPAGRLGLAAEGGIWESADAGQTWRLTFATTLSVSALSRAGDTWWAIGGKFGGYNFGGVSLLLRQGPPIEETDPGRLLPIPCVVPAKGFATVVIEDAQGRRVRNLFADQPRQPGDPSAWWDARDEWGRAVTPGTYRWRGLFHPGLHLAYQFAYNTPNNPPWDVPAGTGGWTADHSNPQAVAAAGDVMLIGCPMAEGGSRVIAVDAATNRKLWQQKGGLILGNHVGGTSIALAADQEYAYAALQTGVGAGIQAGQGGIGFYRLRLSDGTLVAFERTQDDKPLREPDHLCQPQPGAAPAANPWISTAQTKSWSSATCAGSLRGCAVDGERIYLSSYWDDTIYVCDKRNAAPLPSVRVPRPSGLVIASDGRLLAISGDQVVAIDPATGTSTVIIASGLTAPIGLALSPSGEILVSQRGAAMQVAVFSAQGRPLRRIGRAGGRALSGPWQADGMLMPRGLACDSAGRLWVAEEDFAPRRLSIWEMRRGTLVRDLIGRSTYAATGAAINPDLPTMAADTGTIFTLDWATGSSRPAYTLPRMGVAPGAIFGWPFPGDSAVPHGKVRFLRYQGRQYLLREDPPMQVLELVDGRWLVRAALGDVHTAFALQRFHLPTLDPEIFAVFPGFNLAIWSSTPWPPPPTWKNQAFIWCDRDGDGLVQTAEVEVSDTLAGTWSGLHPRFADDLTALLGDHAVKPAGHTDCGAPLYLMADVKPAVRPVTDHPNGWDVRLRTASGWLLADGYRPGTWYDGSEAPGLLSGYAPDGERRWFYSSWFQVHGSHRAPSPRRGLLAGNWYFGGYVDLGGDLGEVVHMMGNVGQHFLFTADGLYLAALFRDGRTGAAVPSSITRGDRIDDMSNESEGWCSDFFRNATDRRIYLMSCPAHASGPVISEVQGLENVRRLAGGTLTVTPAQAIRARELAAADIDGSPAPLRITTVATPPVIDGTLDEWKLERGVGIPVDDQRGARVALTHDASHLYLAYDVRDPNGFANQGRDPRLLFKTGAAVDLMLGLDEAAVPGRPQPVAGDLRLLLAMPNDQPTAVLYRPVAPGANDGTTFSSPQGSVAFDSVRVVATARIGFQRRPGGFALEAAIPLAELGWTIKPKVDLRGDVGVIYGDPEGIRNVHRTYWSNRNTGLVSDVGNESRLVPSQWGRIVVEP